MGSAEGYPWRERTQSKDSSIATGVKATFKLIMAFKRKPVPSKRSTRSRHRASIHATAISMSRDSARKLIARINRALKGQNDIRHQWTAGSMQSLRKVIEAEW